MELEGDGGNFIKFSDFLLRNSGKLQVSKMFRKNYFT